MKSWSILCWHQCSGWWNVDIDTSERTHIYQYIFNFCRKIGCRIWNTSFQPQCLIVCWVPMSFTGSTEMTHSGVIDQVYVNTMLTWKDMSKGLRRAIPLNIFLERILKQFLNSLEFRVLQWERSYWSGTHSKQLPVFTTSGNSSKFTQKTDWNALRKSKTLTQIKWFGNIKLCERLMKTEIFYFRLLLPKEDL